MLNLEHIQANSTRELVQEKVKTKQSESYCIVLYNDDHNSFQHVIQCLMEVCEHSAEQAEQCAWIVHYKGKCSVKDGTWEKLEPLCSALLDRGLTAEIQTS